MTQPLFEHLTPQLNFLLLSQRQMILLSAFAVALATLATNMKRYQVYYISLILLIYAIAVGATAAVDFNNYINDVKNDSTPLEEDELRFVNRSQKWIYFSYAQILITIILAIVFIKFRTLF